MNDNVRNNTDKNKKDLDSNNTSDTKNDNANQAGGDYLSDKEQQSRKNSNDDPKNPVR